MPEVRGIPQHGGQHGAPLEAGHFRRVRASPAGQILFARGHVGRAIEVSTQVAVTISPTAPNNNTSPSMAPKPLSSFLVKLIFGSSVNGLHLEAQADRHQRLDGLAVTGERSDISTSSPLRRPAGSIPGCR